MPRFTIYESVRLPAQVRSNLDRWPKRL